ncbi:MAG: LysR family transcriptional regulator [Litorimonas sp.]
MDRLRRMEIFVSVVEAGQFTRAANRLSLSKSTVSQAVSDLETYLGLQLFHRDSRSLQLTESGETYFSECQRVLSEISALEDHIRGENLGMTGLIRITAPMLYGVMILEPLIVKFMNLYPDISFDLMWIEAPIDLVAEGVDVAFRLGKTNPSSLLTRKIGSMSMVLCATPEYLDKHGAPQSLSDLKNHNCLIFSEIPGWYFEKDGIGFILPVKGRVQTSCANSLRSLVSKGVGIGYFPKFILQDGLANGTLKPVLQEAVNMSFDVNLIRPANKHQPARIKKFTEFMVSNLQEKWPE